MRLQPGVCLLSKGRRREASIQVAGGWLDVMDSLGGSEGGVIPSGDSSLGNERCAQSVQGESLGFDSTGEWGALMRKEL